MKTIRFIAAWLGCGSAANIVAEKTVQLWAANHPFWLAVVAALIVWLWVFYDLLHGSFAGWAGFRNPQSAIRDPQS
jgi:hypothetical protein